MATLRMDTSVSLQTSSAFNLKREMAACLYYLCIYMYVIYTHVFIIHYVFGILKKDLFTINHVGKFSNLVFVNLVSSSISLWNGMLLAKMVSCNL